MPQLGGDVGGHALVGGGGGGQHGRAGRQLRAASGSAAGSPGRKSKPQSETQCASSITSSPHGPSRSGSWRGEARVGEPFRGDQQHVEPARAQRRPARSSQSSTLVELTVAARSPARSAAAIWSRISASSGETTRVGPAAGRPQRRGRRPVDRRLAPAGGLHHQHPPPLLDQRLDRADLVRPRPSVGPGHGGDDPFECVATARHRAPPLGRHPIGSSHDVKDVVATTPDVRRRSPARVRLSRRRPPG